VAIPRFSLSHDTFQPADSANYLIFSTRQFELPPHRPATFAVDLAVENIVGEPGDFRREMAAIHAAAARSPPSPSTTCPSRWGRADRSRT
jgi:hypothetical protein